MIGILLAIALTQQPTTCTVVNLSPVAIVCNEGPQQVEIRDFTWPHEWGKGAHLTGRYKAEIVNGEALKAMQAYTNDATLSRIIPLPTGPVVDNEALRQQSLNEQRRWRIPPAQTSGKS